MAAPNATCQQTERGEIDEEKEDKSIEQEKEQEKKKKKKIWDDLDGDRVEIYEGLSGWDLENLILHSYRFIWIDSFGQLLQRGWRYIIYNIVEKKTKDPLLLFL